MEHRNQRLKRFKTMKKILIYFLFFSPFLFSCEEEQDVAPIESLFFGDGTGSSNSGAGTGNSKTDTIRLITLDATEITENSAKVGLRVEDFYLNDSTEEVSLRISFGLKSTGFTTTFGLTRKALNRQMEEFGTLPNLRPNSEYVYRAIAIWANNGKVTTGEIKSFKTAEEGFSPEEYARANYQSLIVEDFSDNSNNWIEASNSSYRFKVENGYYHCQSKNSQYWFVGKIFNMDESRNYEIEARIKFINGSNNARYGILWNARDLNNGYYFNLTNNRQFTVGETKGNGSFNLINWIGWQSDNNILQNDWNRMTIRKYGNTFYFFINEVMVRTRPFVAEKGHQHLFMNGPNTTFHADDYRISYINN
jgi:hypothetical protein